MNENCFHFVFYSVVFVSIRSQAINYGRRLMQSTVSELTAGADRRSLLTFRQRGESVHSVCALGVKQACTS